MIQFSIIEAHYFMSFWHTENIFPQVTLDHLQVSHTMTTPEVTFKGREFGGSTLHSLVKKLSLSLIN
jgi:hypothetical protein